MFTIMVAGFVFGAGVAALAGMIALAFAIRAVRKAEKK